MYSIVPRFFATNRSFQRAYSITVSFADNTPETDTYKYNHAKPYESIPGPKPWPIIGNKWLFLGGLDFLKIFKKMHMQYGDVVSLRKFLPRGDAVILYDVRDIEWIYRNEEPWPRRYEFSSNFNYRHVVRKDIFGDTYGAINGNYEHWASYRSVVNPIMLQPRSTHQYIPQINDIADEFIENVRRLKAMNPDSEVPRNFEEELYKWAFESIALLALDTRLGLLSKQPSPEAEAAMKHIQAVIDLIFKLDLYPTGQFHIKYNTPIFKKFVKHQDFFTNMVMKLVEKAEEKIKNDPNYANKAEHDKSVFERLVHKDKKIAMVMTLDMIGAGIDTTGKTVATMLYFLAKNPVAQQRLREELKRLLPKKDSPITREILNEAKYLRAVIKEVFRVAPTGTGNFRKMTKPMVVGGYQIPNGTLVWVPNLYLSKGTDKYFSKPDEFIPERWFREKDVDKTHAFVTMPFGFGVRSCIGRRMATMEIEVMLAKMVRSFVLDWKHKDMRFKQTLLYGIDDPLRLTIIDVPN